MMTGDPLTILLRYNHWTTRQILDACVPLDASQFHRKFEMGPGSLHDTLTHIIGAMRRWAERIGDMPRTDPIEDRPHAAEELISMLDRAAADLEASARRVTLEGRLGEVMSFQPAGHPEYRFTRGAALVHVTTHGTHHRAQCLNMLRHLNLGKPLPEIDPIDWQISCEKE